MCEFGSRYRNTVAPGFGMHYDILPSDLATFHEHVVPVTNKLLLPQRHMSQSGTSCGRRPYFIGTAIWTCASVVFNMAGSLVVVGVSMYPQQLASIRKSSFAWPLLAVQVSPISACF